MRLAPYIALPAALAACTPAPSRDAAAGLPVCTAPVRKEISLSAPDARDMLEFNAVGMTCAQAVILTTVRNADGKLIWTRSDTASDTFAFVGAGAGETPEEGVTRLMNSWARIAAVSTTADAPDWKENADRPRDETGLWFGTRAPRQEYLAERAAARPMLCHPFGVNQQVCVAYYPDGVARPLYEVAS